MKKLSTLAFVATAALALAACNKPAETDNVAFENDTTLNTDDTASGGNLAVDDTDALTNATAVENTGDALVVNETSTTTNTVN